MSEKKIIGTTNSGVPIYNYENTPQNMPIKKSSDIEKVIEHVEKYLGPISYVSYNNFNGVETQFLFVEPTVEIPYYKVVTAGSSDYKMCLLENDTEDVERYVETMILLPLDWKVDEKSLNDNKYSWPLYMINNVCAFPHLYNTRIGCGHTLTNGLESKCYDSSTKLNSCLLYPAISCPVDFHKLILNEEKTIYFYNLYPLYQEELDYKLNNGLDSLLDLFQKYGILDNIMINRKNVAKKKWFLF